MLVSADHPLAFAGYRPLIRNTNSLHPTPYLPRAEAERKFLFAGSTGTGKTLSMRVLLKSALAGFIPGTTRQALVYDPKGDMPSILRGILNSFDEFVDPDHKWPEVKLLHPFDRRGWAYDLAADFRTSLSSTNAADNLAATLVPTAGMGEENRFFASSAQRVLSAIVQSLVRRTADLADGPGAPPWTLRDVVTIACDARLLKATLDGDPFTRRVLSAFEATAETYGNVLQTLVSFLWPLETSATAWDHHLRHNRGFTYDTWLKGRGVFVLCGSYLYPHTVEPLNALLIEFLRQRLMVLPEADWAGDENHRENWLFLDEFPDMNPVPEMATFFTKSRSKGGIQVIGFQSIEQLSKRYSPEVAKTILGQFRNLFLTNLSCPSTAQYFVDRFGEYEDLVETKGSSAGYSDATTYATPHGSRTITYNTSESLNQTFVTRKAVPVQSLMTLPEVQRGHRDQGAIVTGYLMLRQAFCKVRYSAEADGLEKIPSDDPEDNFAPLHESLCRPRPFSRDDFERLSVDPPEGYFLDERKPLPHDKKQLPALERWRSPFRSS